MTNSPTATQLIDVMKELRSRLEAERTGGNLWLEDADEVRIGLHAEDASYQNTGVYLVPGHIGLKEHTTMSWELPFTISIACTARSLAGDVEDPNLDPATFTLLRLLGGVIDVAKNARDDGLNGLSVHIPKPPLDVNIDPVTTQNGMYLYYRSVVPVTVDMEQTA